MVPVKKIFNGPHEIFYVGIVLAVALFAGELVAKGVVLWGLGIPGSNYDSYYLHDKRLNL